MPNAKNIVVALLVLCPTWLMGQIGGQSAYQFLNMPLSARSTALGGKIATCDDADVSLVFSNPSLLDTTMHNHIDMSYINYISDVNYASAVYAHKFRRVGMAALGVQQVGYGHFDRANTSGEILGSFSCNETCISGMYSYQIDSSFRLGATLKLANSVLASYWSIGLATDIGAYYASRGGLFSASLILRNAGVMLKGYTGHREPLPFEIIAGISKKMEHAPFRLFITLHQLQTINLRYRSTSRVIDTFGGSSNNSENIVQKVGGEIVSHVILGVEFVPNRNLYLRMGYNHQRRNELQIQQRSSLVGFSGGIGIRISKFNISYSFASYHLAGTSHHFSITTNLGSFTRRM